MEEMEVLAMMMVISITKKNRRKNIRRIMDTIRTRVIAIETAIQHMIDQEAQYEAEDAARNLRMKAKNYLQEFCYAVMRLLQEEPNSTEDVAGALKRQDVTTTLQQALDWADENPYAKREEFEWKLKLARLVVAATGLLPSQ